MPVNELDGIPDAFCNVFDRNKSVGILKFNHVEGWDVKMHIRNSKKRSRICEEEEEEGDCNGTYDCLNSPPSMVRGSSKSFPDPDLSPRAISHTLSLESHNHIRQGEQANIYDSGARFVHPHDLTARQVTKRNCDGSVSTETVLHDPVGPLGQFVFECSTAELLNFDINVLRKVVACPHFNDLRTIFLTHDKRMLSVLSSSEILSDYASPDDALILRQHIIPTYIVGVHVDIVIQAKIERDMWILKPNSGGKGVGIVFGRDCSSDAEWVQLLDDPQHQCFVLQKVVEQQHVNILTATGTEEMLVVGLLHCFNSTFFGR